MTASAPAIEELENVSDQLSETRRLVGQVRRDPVNPRWPEISVGVDQRVPLRNGTTVGVGEDEPDLHHPVVPPRKKPRRFEIHHTPLGRATPCPHGHFPFYRKKRARRFIPRDTRSYRAQLRVVILAGESRWQRCTEAPLGFS